jgi:hypothetical protein
VKGNKFVLGKNNTYDLFSSASNLPARLEEIRKLKTVVQENKADD